MFLEKYLNETYLNLLFDKYEDIYLENINEENFAEIYKLFKEYNFYFIEDIIILYLEIFTLPKDKVKDEILKLKDSLGENFIYIIGNDLRYLNNILENIKLER